MNKGLEVGGAHCGRFRDVFGGSCCSVTLKRLDRRFHEEFREQAQMLLL